MVRYTRDFADRRRVTDDAKQMNRLYVIESSPTLTGAKAEHRLPIRSSDIEGFARGLAAAVGAGGQAGAPGGPNEAKWIAAIGKDLQGSRGRSVVMAGEFQPAAVHALAHAMNQALGNIGTTVTYGGSIEPQPVSQHASLAELSTAMDAGQVQVLVILGNNPVFTAPADVKFAERLAQGRTRRLPQPLSGRDRPSSRTGTFPTRTRSRSWGDPRAYDGTVTLMQPLIAPLYDAHSAHELLATLTEPAGAEDARPRQGLLDARVRRRDRMDRPERRRRDVRERRLVLETGRARRFHPRHGHVNRWSGYAVQAACGRPGGGTGCRGRCRRCGSGRCARTDTSSDTSARSHASRASSGRSRARADLPARSDGVGRPLRQ